MSRLRKINIYLEARINSYSLKVSKLNNEIKTHENYTLVNLLTTIGSSYAYGILNIGYADYATGVSGLFCLYHSCNYNIKVERKRIFSNKLKTIHLLKNELASSDIIL